MAEGRGPARQWLWPALAALLAASQALLLARTAWDKSDTIDEPYYLASAVEQWLHGDFSRSCDTPALPKWAFAAALRAADPPLFDLGRPGGRHPLWSRATPELRRNLLAARATTILLTVAGGLFLWAAALAFGRGCALVAHASWCFSPTVLAHGSLATLDAWVASLLAAALWAAIRAYQRPSPARAALVGVLVGLAAASKATALPALPVALAVLAAAALRHTARPRSSRPQAAIVHASSLAAAFGVTLWAVYGFDVGPVDVARPCGRETGLAARRLAPVPFAPWVEGLVLQAAHGGGGHLSYLFGQVSSGGWWWFYLAAIALKTTLGAQAAVLLRLAAWLRARPARRRLLVDATLLAYPALLLLALSMGRAQNGVRYLLPAFPFVFLWLGRGVEDVRRAFGRPGVAALAAALTAAAIESLAVHPHHLMFFNLWAGGPDGGPRYLVHGDDWGQDQRRLGEWQAANRPWRLFYTYYNGDPAHWGITSTPPSCQPEPGVYALHAVEVHRPKRLPAGCLDWLTVEPPDARIGHSIYLYQVNRPRIERLLAERATTTPFWRSGSR